MKLADGRLLAGCGRNKTVVQIIVENLEVNQYCSCSCRTFYPLNLAWSVLRLFMYLGVSDVMTET